MSKLILGVGFNSGGKYKATIDGKKAKSYATWQNMLYRAYCPKYQARQPTYIGCSVDGEWHDFQDFADWFSNHKYSDYGYELDKDLLLPGNKIYTPNRCVFVPSQLNNLLLDRDAARGQYKQGVDFNKRRNKFRAQMSLNGKKQHIGYFDTPQEARQVYKTVKEAYVKEKALEWQDRIADNVFQALMDWQLTE